MNEELSQFMVMLGATILWFGLALTWVTEWDRARQLRADREFQPRATITIKKRLVYEPKHSKHIYEQNRR